ncbi:GT4 family glycosyltransferase PelF [Zeaxanthinibacter enoshimensis]|uniref:Glycosyltransferase involved in cell wall biosynthesis n=1 Tax=Zeaxanthinibacter enoshimensis TaxID=392009 RepID=A0A4R6TNC0_9FLAO|nr:GT4 family glycosyltransferase PelF [Zeaxanthinibacter enoshimensis]TDQ32580.1 glycosyltransferase involved in cell wall biosynthesis [Zeaxanthinibacter enoshimensis]
MKRPISILLITEGTYPFHAGGVSTWAHQLCEKVKHAEFSVYSINAGVEGLQGFQLSGKVKELVQLPMWAPDEPGDCMTFQGSYSQRIVRKEATGEGAVSAGFIPSFKNFLKAVLVGHQDQELLDQYLYGMWSYFREFDYKDTMTSRAVWECYKETVSVALPEEESQMITLEDLTTGMRWLYRFMMPISLEPPKVDIAHMTIAGIALFPALSLKYRYNTPLVLTEHGVYIRERLISLGNSNFSPFLKKLLINLSETLTRLVYHHADIITTVSKFNIRWERYYGAHPDKIRIIYNGVDTGIFKPRPKPPHLQQVPTVVAAARIFELKDIKTMIKVCYEVRKKIPEVHFLVYGNKDAVPQYTLECESLVQKLGVEDNFSLKGFHPSPEAIYCEGDISILTSISEGFPYTVLESMSCGVPVVATDVGGVSEALDLDSGFLCKPRDHIALADRVIRLLENKELRRSMGINGRNQVLKKFTIDHFTQAFECAYLSMTENKYTQAIPGSKEMVARYGKKGT